MAAVAVRRELSCKHCITLASRNQLTLPNWIQRSSGINRRMGIPPPDADGEAAVLLLVVVDGPVGDVAEVFPASALTPVPDCTALAKESMPKDRRASHTTGICQLACMNASIEMVDGMRYDEGKATCRERGEVGCCDTNNDDDMETLPIFPPLKEEVEFIMKLGTGGGAGLDVLLFARIRRWEAMEA